ncbi:unnamed protein product [Nippostrongylus brasiliensis]|uniref:Lipid A biosynthesis lauroyl acyltransferase n=1 Tax=Nippostrongylus brasiliensis TaxID=27835 RepID=A0A0N4XWG7_NIPBR|nr:unnamed protein product [Nippostrongylus brasiliensis]
MKVWILRNFLEVFNWYCVLVPVVMIYAAKRTRKERRRNIETVMGKQRCGEEGADYYFSLLHNHWQLQDRA